MSKRDPTDLRGQEASKTENEQARKLTVKQEAEDFRWLVSDARGRRFVWRMLEQTGVFRSSFTGNSETFFREGARNVGLKIMADLHAHSPESYFSMIQENNAK
jgi:hypothetical protein